MAWMRAGAALLVLLLLAAAETAAQETGVAITGQVLGLGRLPVANAEVELRPVPSRYQAALRAAAGEDPAPPAARTLTGPDGRFTLSAPGAGMWCLVVAAAGFLPQQRSLLPLLADTALLPVELAAGSADGRRAAEPAKERPRLLGLAAPGSLTGRVIDRETRRPIPDAWVWPASDPGLWVRTNANGAFVLRGIAVSSEPAVEAAARDHAAASVSLQGGLPPVLALAPTATLSGLVTDARDRPLADVEVRVSRLRGPAEEPEAHVAWTSPAGAFRVPGLHGGASYGVIAVVAGFSPAATAVAVPNLGAPFPALRLVLDRGRTARGQVVDDAGRPVAGALVQLVPGTTGRVVATAPAADAGALPPARTGRDGKFELPHAPAGWFSLRIEAVGFPPLERSGLQIAAAATPVDLGRFVLASGSTFRGWVGDPDGKPLPGAEVWVIPTPVRDWSDLYAKGPAAVTGADGSFAVRDLPSAESFGLDVCRAGYLPVSATLREMSPQPFQAVLQRAVRISGRVTAAGGAPVAAARVEAWLAGEEPGAAQSLRPCRRGAGSTTTDAEGHFRLDGLPPGWWSVRASAEGYRDATRERLHVLAGEDREDVELILDPGAVVTGRVFTADGRPAAGARVSALSAAGTVETQAGGDGAYRLAGVETGERTFEATLGEGRWASRQLTVVAGENRLDLTMDQGSPRQEIRGRVVGPDRAPIAGAAVLAGSSARSFSAADGTFALSVEDGQVYDVWAEKERFAAAKAGAPVRVAGSPVEGVEIQLSRGGSLTGRLLGLDREELAQATVEVELMPPFIARAAVEPQGTYRLEDVPPGEWTVTARSADRAVSERAVLAPGASGANVDLAFEPSQEVSGEVVSSTGEPVAGAYVRFFAPGGASGNAYSRADGSFRLRLEDGTYRVVGRREGYLWTMQKEPITVAGGPLSGLEVKLDEAAVIRGRILGLDPGERAKAVWASTGGGRREGQLDQEDGFVISDLPPGDWTVTVLYDGSEVSSSVHLEAGREEWVEVDLGNRSAPNQLAECRQWQPQGQRMIRQCVKLVASIKGPGSLVLGVDNHCSDSDLLGDTQAAGHGVEQELLPKTLSPLATIDGERCQPRNRQGKVREPSGRRSRQVRFVDRSYRQGVVAENPSGLGVRYGNEGAGNSRFLVLPGEAGEVFVESWLAAVEARSVVVSP